MPGFASAQKVVQLSYCSVAENHLRMDCKYALPAESPEPLCKYTQGERLLDTTDPDEEQHAPYKNRAKARIFPGNICRLLFKNLPKGKSNFTCNIRQGDSATAAKTSVVEKSKQFALSLIVLCNYALPVILNAKRKQLFFWNDIFLFCFYSTELLLPCSAWSILLQNCNGLLLTLMTLSTLLWSRHHTAAYVNTCFHNHLVADTGLSSSCVYAQSAIDQTECTYIECRVCHRAVFCIIYPRY